MKKIFRLFHFKNPQNLNCRKIFLKLNFWGLLEKRQSVWSADYFTIITDEYFHILVKSLLVENYLNSTDQGKI